jgi:uncharacterized protein (UPF0303 family)
MTDDDLLETLQRQEEEIQFRGFNNELAWEVGSRLVEAARTAGKAITVDIRRTGQQLFHYALPGTSPDNDSWVRRKSRVVERFGHSSYFVGRLLESQDVTIEQKYLVDERKYAPHGGSFPITVKGVGVVGAVTVSGLPQAEDHDFVVRILRQFCDRAG